MLMEGTLPGMPVVAGRMSVLLATDGSDHALRAARFLARIMGPLGPDQGVIHVHTVLSATMEPTSYLGDLSDAPARHEAIRAMVDRATAGARQVLEEAGIETTTSKSFGHPPDEVLAEAESLDVDLVVVGRRGVRMPAALMLGSVSSYLLHHATMPVLIVP
ncbi:MAG TPA: universal stress protein [Actinomycetota bacterium]|nr:universal stress protein [Actinomycetota bacterium]